MSLPCPRGRLSNQGRSWQVSQPLPWFLSLVFFLLPSDSASCQHLSPITLTPLTESVFLQGASIAPTHVTGFPLLLGNGLHREAVSSLSLEESKPGLGDERGRC